MSEMSIFSQVTSAFEPFVRSPEELHHIRLQIARYVGSLQVEQNSTLKAQGKLTIPAHVTGVRQHFLKTQHLNTAAEQECQRLRNSLLPQHIADSQSQKATTSEAPHSAHVLRRHLEVLRLRKQYQKYLVISHYIAEAEALAEQNRLDGTPPPIETPFLEPKNPSSSTRPLLDSQLQDMTRRLELTVLQTNHELKKERQLLADAKPRYSLSENVSSEVKLRALVAARTELTKWIEECLAKCDSVNETAIAGSINISNEGHDIAKLSKDIDEQYEIYLKARRRLLNAANELTTPCPSTVSSQKSKDQQIAQDSVSSTTGFLPLPSASVMPFLDSQHLSVVDWHHAMLQLQLEKERILSEYAQDASEQLLRLGDESHLLPSFPILAKSKQSEESSATDRLLQAWQFAMEASGTATAATIENQVGVGRRSVEQLSAIFEEQAVFADMWKKLETK